MKFYAEKLKAIDIFIVIFPNTEILPEYLKNITASDIQNQKKIRPLEKQTRPDAPLDEFQKHLRFMVLDEEASGFYNPF